MTSAPVPANWYPDPHNPAQLRYWDGAQWTGHSAPREPEVRPAQPPSTVGPRVALASGIACLALAVAAWVGSGAFITNVFASGVVDPDGNLSQTVLGPVELPGEGTFALEPGPYVVHLATPENSAVTLEQLEALRDETQASLLVTAPDGSLRATSEPTVGTAFEDPDMAITSLAVFEVEAAGDHRITADAPEPIDGNPFRMFIAPDTTQNDNTEFAGTIGLSLAATFLGLMGLGLTIGAVGWRSHRNGRVAAGGAASGPS